MTNDSELLIILRLQYHNEKNRPYFKEKKSKLTRKGNVKTDPEEAGMSLMDISKYFIVFTKE